MAVLMTHGNAELLMALSLLRRVCDAFMRFLYSHLSLRRWDADSEDGWEAEQGQAGPGGFAVTWNNQDDWMNGD